MRMGMGMRIRPLCVHADVCTPLLCTPTLTSGVCRACLQPPHLLSLSLPSLFLNPPPPRVLHCVGPDVLRPTTLAQLMFAQIKVAELSPRAGECELHGVRASTGVHVWCACAWVAFVKTGPTGHEELGLEGAAHQQLCVCVCVCR